MEKRSKDPRVQLSVRIRAPRYVGYHDYFAGEKLSVVLKNEGAETAEVTLLLSSKEGLIVPLERKVEIPFESTVEVEEALFSPQLLAENDALLECGISARVLCGGGEVCAAEEKILALPFDRWEGISGNAERLAAFVRPQLSVCSFLHSEAAKRLKQWKDTGELSGYAGTDKNSARRMLAALFGALKAGQYAREAAALSSPLPAFHEKLTEEKRANVLEMGVLLCASLEAARLHPVLAVGKKSVAVGIWLHDSCFLDPVTDDTEVVSAYVGDGVNELSFVDAEDLFSSSNAAFTASEAHARRKIEEGAFEYFVDIRRCRLDGVRPCPLRERRKGGYELLTEEETDLSVPPAPLPERKRVPAGKSSAEKEWEKSLLDLTGKNALLNFTGKNAVHLASGDADALLSRLAEREKLRASGENVPAFGGAVSGQRRELLLLEQGKGSLRAFCSERELSETAAFLLRRGREAEEETGAKVLYAAFGFLGYFEKGEKAMRYAPLVLAPAELTRAGEGFALCCPAGEYFVNHTLLEYLKRNFDIDVRGLGEDVSSLKIADILAMVRVETAGMKGWKVVPDVYLSVFSFPRFLLWNDLHTNMGEFRKNPIVAGLLGKGYSPSVPALPSEDEADPAEVLLPLPSDSSQYEAVALSATSSFVLHGPPGTGKSQTIASIIAGALARGERVLFVAEKRAALEVVSHRLESIGVGDFCLPLYAGKTDRAEALAKLERTLLLPRGEEVSLSEKAKEVALLREELKKTRRALHERRKLGVSVYDAIAGYLKYKDAPDVLDVESSFYDSLTEEKLASCRSMLFSAAAAAKECGGVVGSPFENVNLTEYSRALRDRVFCAAQVLLTEIRHVRSFLELFLGFYRQRISFVTERKLRAVASIAGDLSAGKYQKYFSGAEEEDFGRFYRANLRLDELLSYYQKHFRTLIDAEADEELVRFTEEGGDWRACRSAKAAVKKLMRASLHPIDDADILKYLQTFVGILSAMEEIRTNTALPQNFCDRAGRFNFKKREEFLSDLYALHESCAAVFTEYNADAFNGMCIRAADGYTAPVLDGYRKAAEGYLAAQESFLTVTAARRDRISGEDLLDYFSARASALIDNIDMLASWCNYRSAAEKLTSLGLKFMTDALESGKLSTENVLAGFEKNLYKNFLENTIPADEALCRITAGTATETAEKLRLCSEELSRLSRAYIRDRLLSRLPAEEGAGAPITRLKKSGGRLRTFFHENEALARLVCPCLLMSPAAVARYLPANCGFDLVIFDEASQMPTAEAIGPLARGKRAVVVGDPRQLPPTSFFRAEESEEESVLDDCLALGMPERHLLWHYRSHHESLIAFSNGMYYDNRLRTFPSPDAESRVRLVPVEGVYDRGGAKCNRAEAEALVREICRRLSDGELKKNSMGVVTFSGAQQELIEKLLSAELRKSGLEDAAYSREEPLFVKNLENVQGDERDVILFSVCYGPDKKGRVSLNFGPLNRAGGWRRLNVAVSRAREEMLVFSSLDAAKIDLSKTSSKGAAGLKAFLEFAEKGRTTLAVPPSSVRGGTGAGRYLAEGISACGYECRLDVGASELKVDVAVLDPADPRKFLLGILLDAPDPFSVKDREILRPQALKRSNWNILFVSSVNFFCNPKREIKRVKDVLDRLTGGESRAGDWLSRYKRPYRAVGQEGAETAAFITGGEHEEELVARLKELVAAEEPISRAFLIKRCMQTFGIVKAGSKAEGVLSSLIDGCAFKRDRVMGVDYFYRNARVLQFNRVRVEEKDPVRRSEEDISVYETVALIKGALEDRVSLYLDEIVSLASGVFGVRRSARFPAFVRECVRYGEEKGIFVRSVSDRVTLA